MTIEELASLAMEMEATDPMDWGLFPVSKVEAYRLMASYIVDQDDIVVLQAAVTKLLVENFILNLRQNADF